MQLVLIAVSYLNLQVNVRMLLIQN